MKVSFVIPSYNSASWLAHALKSVQEQTHSDIEAVVVDDASTDSTPDLMRYLCEKDRRIKWLRNEKNMGRSTSRNRGNLEAKGDVICVLDADDIAYPERAALMAQHFKKGAAEFIYASMDVIDALGFKRGTIEANVFNKHKALTQGVNNIVHSSVAYTKAFAEAYPYISRVGGFDIAGLGMDDWHQQITAVAGGAKLDFIPNVVGAYRVLDTGVSSTRDESKVKEAKDSILAGLAASV